MSFHLVSNSRLSDEWEIDDTHLKVFYDQRLGSGRFGTVYLGLFLARPIEKHLLAQLAPDFHSPANGPVILDDQRRVAAKTCVYGDKTARKALFDEIEGMKLVGRNPRIASLLGNERGLLLVNSNCRRGSPRGQHDNGRRIL